MSTSRGRLLVVTPKFHGYWRSIARAFRELGYAVSTHRYDERPTALAGAMHKLRYEVPPLFGHPTTAAVAARASEHARRAVLEAKPDLVLVIKGDKLTDAFWAAVERVGARAGLWLYDELRRTKHTEESLNRVHRIASYSRADVAALIRRGHDARHVPLAYDPSIPVVPAPGRDVVFVGARYPNRERALLTLSEAGLSVRAYGRDWSRHPVDRIRSLHWSRPAVSSGRDVDLAEAYGLMAGAAATLNIHGDQDGFTMRTFEACGVGAVQLTDRADVAEFYAPGSELAVFSSQDELVELATRATTDREWGDGLRRAGRARTLAEHTFAHRAKALEELWA